MKCNGSPTVAANFDPNTDVKWTATVSKPLQNREVKTLNLRDYDVSLAGGFMLLPDDRY